MYSVCNFSNDSYRKTIHMIRYCVERLMMMRMMMMKNEKIYAFQVLHLNWHMSNLFAYCTVLLILLFRIMKWKSITCITLKLSAIADGT